jgi:hypothetical protein
MPRQFFSGFVAPATPPVSARLGAVTAQAAGAARDASSRPHRCAGETKSEAPRRLESGGLGEVYDSFIADRGAAACATATNASTARSSVSKAVTRRRHDEPAPSQR